MDILHELETENVQCFKRSNFVTQNIFVFRKY